MRYVSSPGNEKPIAGNPAALRKKEAISGTFLAG
jgi:hypothetical protein